jgi:hypothetical protein
MPRRREPPDLALLDATLSLLETGLTARVEVEPDPDARGRAGLEYPLRLTEFAGGGLSQNTCLTARAAAIAMAGWSAFWRRLAPGRRLREAGIPR